MSRIRQILRRAVLLSVASVVLLIAGGLGALQIPVVHRYLVYSPAVDALYHRLTPDPNPYPTFRQSLINNFPGFAYAYITQRLVGSERDPEVIIRTLTTYVHENIFAPSQYAVVDDAPITVLHRGIGWCDQMGHLLLRLLDRRDIPSRLLFLRNKEGISPHSVADVYLNGTWRIVDPTYMFIPRNGRKEVATFGEICQEGVDFGTLPPEDISLPGYRQWFCQEPRIFLSNFAFMRPALIEAVRRGEPFPGNTMAESWQRLFALPDPIGTDLFINLYVQAIRDLYETEDGYAYGVARTYHILGKFREARRWYAKTIANFPNSPHLEESLFFAGLAAYHEGEYQKAKDSLDKLLNQYPQTSWAAYARLFVGKSLLALGQHQQAKAYLAVLKLDSDETVKPARDALRLLGALTDKDIE